MRNPFTTSRSDGRSDRRVVVELAWDAVPDTRFAYDELQDALQEGLEKPVERERIYRAVGAANTTLLKEQKRYLQVVPDFGYRVIHTSEAVAVALDKKGRAETYLAKGVALLRNANLDELTGAQRTLHEGQLLVMAGLYEATRRSERRHDRADKAISELVQRVERLEGDKETEN